VLVEGGSELRKDTVDWILSIKWLLAAAASALVWQRRHLSHVLKIQNGQEVEFCSIVADSAHT